MARVAEQIHVQAELPRRKITGMRIGKQIRRHWALYLLMIVPLAFLITFSYVPMAGAQIAFRDYNPIQGIWNSPWIGMQEVDFWIQSPYFWPIVTNTLVLGLYSLAVGTPAAIILALALNEVKLAFFKRSVQLITFAPYFISAVVLVSLLQIMLAPTVGPLADLYRVLGLGTPPDLFASPSAFPSLYVWSGVWQTSGYGAVVYLAALSNASPELYEAARIDGASRIQRIIHVDWPVLKPTVIILFILTIGTVLGASFEKVYLMQTPLNLSTSEVISTYTYKMGLVDANFTFAGVVGLFNSVVGFILVLLTNIVARFVSQTSLF